MKRTRAREWVTSILKKDNKILVSDEEVYKLLLECVQNGWVEEMRLAIGLPTSPVWYLYIVFIYTYLIISCGVCFEFYITLHILKTRTIVI